MHVHSILLDNAEKSKNNINNDNQTNQVYYWHNTYHLLIFMLSKTSRALLMHILQVFAYHFWYYQIQSCICLATSQAESNFEVYFVYCQFTVLNSGCNTEDLYTGNIINSLWGLPYSFAYRILPYALQKRQSVVFSIAVIEVKSAPF